MKPELSSIKRDPWLERWLPLIGAQVNPARVLELGCGEGWDTQVLLDQGLTHITALDFSAKAVARCQARSNELNCLVHDLQEPLPFADGTFEVVLASLCLHYFSWQTTKAIAEEIRRVLIPGGLLLCRVNSTLDVHYGAVGHPELEPHFYQVDDERKRFFDQTDVEALFQNGWRVRSQQEMQVARYAQPKSVWEVVLTTQE